MSDVNNENIGNNQEENQNREECNKNWWKSCWVKTQPTCLLKSIFITATILIAAYFAVCGYVEYNFKKKYKHTALNNFLYVGKMKNKRANASMVLLPNGNVVIAGGITQKNINSFEIFFPVQGKFKEIKLPAEFGFPRNSMLISDKEVLINDSFVYNYKTGKYINILNRKNLTNYSNSFWIYKDVILIIDVIDEKNKNINYYTYNTKTKILNKFNLKIPFTIHDKKIIPLDNYNLFIYGDGRVKRGSKNLYSTFCFIWNVKENTYKKYNLNYILSQANIAKLNNSELIIIAKNQNKYIVSFILNIYQNNIVELPSFNVNRTSIPLLIALSNGNFIVIGGESSEQRNMMTAEFFDKEKFKYSTLDTIRSLYIPAIPLGKPSMVELLNKDIFICGGIYESNIQDKCYILKGGK